MSADLYQVWAIDPVAPDHTAMAWRRGDPMPQTRASVTVRRLNRRRPHADDTRFVSLPVGETPAEYVARPAVRFDDETTTFESGRA